MFFWGTLGTNHGKEVNRMRLSFHNICLMLLKPKRGTKVFKNLLSTIHFFIDCFCDNKVFLNVNSEIATMLIGRTMKQNRAKQHSWLNNDFGTFLLNLFNVEECCKRIEEYLTANEITIIKDFYDVLNIMLTADNLGLNSEINIDGCKKSKNEYIIDFISNDIKHEDVYTALIFLLLVSLYPGGEKLDPAEDHSDDLVKFIEQYKLQHSLKGVFYNPVKSDDANDIASMTLLLRSTAKYQHNLAANGIGRFIPPVLAKEYPHLENPTLCSTYSGQEEHLSLEEIINKHSQSNIMAIGRGGCGKTYTLFHLAGKFLEGNYNAIPIYVSLNGFNSNNATNNSIIFDYCCDILKDNSKFSMDKIKDRLIEWLREEHDDYILLLLDGFNELTSTDLQIRIANEVKLLQAKYNNLRFVITSRYDMKDTFACGSGNISHSFLSYSVDELSLDVVKRYISEFFKDDEEHATKAIQKAMVSGKNDTVKSFLRNPMALVMYCYMSCKNAQKEIFPHHDYSTLGELIDNFVWLIKSCIIDDALLRNTYDKAELFLQYVGFCMNGDGVFKISASTLGKYANKFGMDFEIAKWEKVDLVKDTMKYTMHGTSVTHIEFVHQNYRDYFAAGYLKSVLLSGDCDAIDCCFGEKIIPEEVCVLLGDILEEYKYKNLLSNNDDSVIQSVLTEMCDDLSRATVAQLIRIAAIARENDLSLFDFSGLDLTAASLNGIKLYKDKKVFAKFDRTLLTKATLNAQGHPGSVSSMLLIENNRFLVTFSKLGIFCFDMELRNHYRVADYDACAIRASISINGSNFILTGDSRGSVVLWEFSITDNWEFKLHKISCKDLYDKGKSENNFLYEIQDLVLFNGRIYVSVAKGDIWSFIIDCKEVSDLRLNVSFNNSENIVNPNCRLSISSLALYCSSGSTVTKLLTDSNNRVGISCQKTFNGTEIIDIAIVELEERDDVLINLKRKGNGTTVSELVRYTFDDDTSDIIERRIHSIKRVGFRGWNSFSEPYCETIYLTANIEDAADTAAGLLKIFFPESFEEDKIYNCIDVFGNRHSMSVNCAIAFNYKQREFIATGSTERSVEILSAEGANMALLYHLMGHDNGIHYIDIVDESKMYAAHYSGEISEWLCKNGHWHCSHVYAAHDNHWVWECRHIAFNNEGDKSYVFSCSYDNTIAVINANTEEIVCRIEEPTSRVLSFGFLSKDIILTGYTKKGNSILRKFKINYNDQSPYTSGVEIPELSNASLEFRSILTAKDRLLLCANGLNSSCIFSIPKKDNLPLDKFIYDRKYEVKEIGYRINLRCVDEITCKGNTIVACGGDSHDSNDRTASYVRVWIDDEKGYPHVHFISDSAGCSTLKLIELEGKVFLVSGSYSGFLSVYSVNETDGEIKMIDSSVKLNDKILNIQAFEDTLYCSLLSGSVYALPLSEITSEHGSSCSGKEIFRSVSGLRCCNVNFSNANKEWDNDFRKLIGYYGKVGR